LSPSSLRVISLPVHRARRVRQSPTLDRPGSLGCSAICSSSCGRGRRTRDGCHHHPARAQRVRQTPTIGSPSSLGYSSTRTPGPTTRLYHPTNPAAAVRWPEHQQLTIGPRQSHLRKDQRAPTRGARRGGIANEDARHHGPASEVIEFELSKSTPTSAGKRRIRSPSESKSEDRANSV
jgi:hypothetical protein